MVDGATRYLEEFNATICTSMEVLSIKPDDVRWKPPDNRKWIVNADAVTNNSNDDRSLGVLIRNTLDSIEEVEALAIKWGFFSALEAGLSRFSNALDCLTIVNALKSKDKAFCEFGVLLDEIFSLTNCSNFESFVFVPRCANKDKHCLARFVVLSNSSQVWKGEILIFAWSVVCVDMPLPMF